MAMNVELGKILVIEDNRDSRDILAKLLRMSGYDVMSADDGEAGLAAALKQNPDLIITDIHMPNMNGIEFVQRVRQDQALDKTPVLVVTAFGAHVAREAIDAGADAISLVNTFVGMAIDAKARKPRISNVTAGLSGPAIKPIALRMVYEAAHSVEIPVIGMGGITTAEDAVEFMLAGAAAVQVGTANFWDPCATEKIVDGLQRWCFENRVNRITDIIGTLEA